MNGSGFAELQQHSVCNVHVCVDTSNGHVARDGMMMMMMGMPKQ
jgi:hypothetical protein